MDNLEIRHDPRIERQRSVAAAEEQLRLPADRRLRPAADRPDRAAESLDRAAGKPARLPHAGHRQEDSGAVRAADHLLDEPRAARPGRRSVPAAHSVQDRSQRPVAGGVRQLFEAACQTFGCQFFPEAVHYLIQTHYAPHGRPLRRCQPRDLLVADQELLHVLRPADGAAARLSRPRGEELLHRGQPRTERPTPGARDQAAQSMRSHAVAIRNPKSAIRNRRDSRLALDGLTGSSP